MHSNSQLSTRSPFRQREKGSGGYSQKVKEETDREIRKKGKLLGSPGLQNQLLTN